MAKTINNSGKFCFSSRLHNFYSKIGGPAVIQGSYITGNVGDLAIGFTIKDYLKKIWDKPIEIVMNCKNLIINEYPLVKN